MQKGIGDSINMAKRIEEATGMETRATILDICSAEEALLVKTEYLLLSWVQKQLTFYVKAKQTVL